MNGEKLFRAIGQISDEKIAEADTIILKPKPKQSAWIKYGSLAACLYLVLWGAYIVFRPASPGIADSPVLQWSEQFSAADYFKYNSGADGGLSSSSSRTDSAMPYAESRSFSDERARLEAEGVIPAMAEHPMFDCSVNYNDDGSIYSAVFSWHRRDEIYSDLSITAGYQEIEQISDCITIELDENGNIVEPDVTVTERDGIQIIAEGNANRGKTITFQNESGWYQLAGSWNDSYESMALLLDWVWARPINLTRFPIDAGDHFTSIKLEQMPDAFEGYIPDFSAFGFIEETNYLQLKNGTPYAYEGHFIAHAPEELVKEGAYHGVAGWTTIHWCIFTNPEYYSLAESLGELNELTEEIVLSRFDSSRNQSGVSFTRDGVFIKVYSNTAHELWAVLESFMSTRD